MKTALANSLVSFCLFSVALPVSAAPPSGFAITEDAEQVNITGTALDFAIRKKGYVSGVSRGSFLDKQSGFRDPGMGLDIADFLLEPGSDETYRDQLAPGLPYQFNTPYHGKRAKRLVEGPQICTKAQELTPRVIHGRDFLAVTMDWQYHLAAPGKQAGSVWSQTLVFPTGKRYFISSDKITSRNDGDELFLRIDMPGHLKHNRGDTFSEIYLSYVGKIAPQEFFENFAPDEKFNYRRDTNPTPQRLIRAYRLRDPKTGADGPWLAGMTLQPADVYEAWCHQRGYVCFIEEIGGRPIRAGESFSAAFIVGYFDSIEEMERVYDQYAGHSGLEVSEREWKLLR
ncbi:MAG: hypothetical protein HY000_12800 [Planctomycetes bacterium]|nr:hypothetical protein [Planctomycetota bacterium]